ncbi:hypothetical protein N836_28930 [Leptolyngbya sp. Heron Island J]|uniref:hypothetical protein n=1 Tax=Leptolyngbya sp. Heron Island J TaxID=1385935 RepID=UPI0003B969D3|nr:hypothetical protein [Leptolyngbya sp. Heron Island J]ESA39103.1 hypothetical protein N836_28930 [Leptolyngbya sp. Heron Island J]
MDATISISKEQRELLNRAIEWNHEREIFTESEVMALFGFYLGACTWSADQFRQWIDDERYLQIFEELVGEARIEQAFILLEWA